MQFHQQQFRMGMNTPICQDDADARAAIERLDARGRHQLVAHGGCRVAWHAFGDGPPLVLLHGGHGSWLHWVRNIEPLAERFTVWVPDLPGYGKSGAPPADTLDALVDTTCVTLDAVVGADRAIDLAGFSFGGLVAAHIAGRRGNIARLALLGPAGHGTTRRPRSTLRNWRRAADTGDTAALAEAMRHNLAAHMLHDPAAIDALALHIHTDACLRTRFHSKRVGLAGGLWEALDRQHGRLLVAWGEHDVTTTPVDADGLLAQRQPACSTYVIPGAGHWVQYERADAINRLLLGWLDTGHRPEM